MMTRKYGISDVSGQFVYDSLIMNRPDIPMKEAVDILRSFSRSCALEVVHLWNAPDDFVHYLIYGDESTRKEVCQSAWKAAIQGNNHAASAAAWASIRAADAVGSKAASTDAAYCWKAAWSSANDASLAEQKKNLERMLIEFLEGTPCQGA